MIDATAVEEQTDDVEDTSRQPWADVGHINSAELQPTERIDRIEDRVVVFEEQGKVILPQPARVEILTEEAEALR
ncbi:MAG: hypothetical protein OXU69_00375 [Gemmatimonadota bacterium]|nr:hypothetical protein [Gemmatimonadota bacterium]MDE2983132.1 hypothetical protein [Gemmatimonadota bacterium]